MLVQNDFIFNGISIAKRFLETNFSFTLFSKYIVNRQRVSSLSIHGIFPRELQSFSIGNKSNEERSGNNMLTIQITKTM